MTKLFNGAGITEAPTDAEFEVWQDDMVVAGSSGPRESALREIHHYAAQYACDGPVQIFEVHRTLIASANGAVAKESHDE
jgi:hypothetical protein